MTALHADSINPSGRTGSARGQGRWKELVKFGVMYAINNIATCAYSARSVMIYLREKDDVGRTCAGESLSD